MLTPGSSNCHPFTVNSVKGQVEELIEELIEEQIVIDDELKHLSTR